MMTDTIKKDDLCADIALFMESLNETINDFSKEGEHKAAKNALNGLMGVIKLIEFLKQEHDLSISLECSVHSEGQDGEKKVHNFNV